MLKSLKDLFDSLLPPARPPGDDGSVRHRRLLAASARWYLRRKADRNRFPTNAPASGDGPRHDPEGK